MFITITFYKIGRHDSSHINKFKAYTQTRQSISFFVTTKYFVTQEILTQQSENKPIELSGELTFQHVFQ